MTDKKQVVVLGAVMTCGVGRALTESLKNSVEVVIPKQPPLTMYEVLKARQDIRDPRKNFKSVNKPVRRIHRGRGR